MDIDEVFRRAALARNTDVESYKMEIAAAIDMCYASGDPKVEAELEKLFMTKPSPEEFIKKVVLKDDKKSRTS